MTNIYNSFLNLDNRNLFSIDLKYVHYYISIYFDNKYVFIFTTQGFD